MLLKKCKCGCIIELGKSLCDDCLKERKQKYSKGYKPPRRNYKEQQFYRSKEWFATRDKIRKRDKYLCMLCYSDGHIKPLKAVHHIVELKDDWNKRTDISNLIGVCREHHDNIHNIYLNPKEKEKLQKDLIQIVGAVVEV